VDIYVASAWANREEVNKIQKLLTERGGHHITHDWTRECETPGFLASQEVRNDYGYKDYMGVVDADAVVVVAHPEAKDTRCEMGIAIGLQKPVIVIHPDRFKSVFLDPRLGVSTVTDTEQLLFHLDAIEQEWFGQTYDKADAKEAIRLKLEFPS
jgi:nucleoside 2-deoxyribosyltransferase